MKTIYLIKHGVKKTGYDPEHDELGKQQIHIVKNILYGLMLQAEIRESKTLPMQEIKWIIRGSGKRHQEMVDKIKEIPGLQDAVVTEHFLLGSEISVFEKDGKDVVIGYDGKEYDNIETCPFVLSNYKLGPMAWEWLKYVESSMEDNSCTILCSGRQFLTILGIPLKEVKAGCLFKIDVSAREVIRFTGY